MHTFESIQLNNYPDSKATSIPTSFTLQMTGNLMKTPLAYLLILSLTPTLKAAEVILEKSPYSHQVTLERLKSNILSKGAKIFSEIHHHKGAESINAPLAANTLILFGNPKIGTPLMQTTPSIGLDLPLRLAVFETNKGDVLVAYRSLSSIKLEHQPKLENDLIAKPDKAIRAIVKQSLSKP